MSSPHIAVTVFPGSNCEFDVAWALERLGARVELVWHHEHTLDGFDAIVLPGGFAHGDYLRPGAIAQFSPIMEAVRAAADRGIPVVGICNGFQILTEAKLLPGALQKNAGLEFICDTVELEVSSRHSPLTAESSPGQVISLPINHFEGNFTCSPATLRELVDEDRVIMRYRENPNGSVDSIAGISNRRGNVVGLMPHPERACDTLTGSTDGRSLLESLLRSASSVRS